MPLRAPTLRRHATGVWFCRWGGKDRYFSVDKAGSERAFAASIEEWALWRQQRQRISARRGRLTLAQLVAAFLEAHATDSAQKSHAYFRYHLGRFTRLWGAVPAELALKAANLQALKADMVAAVKRDEQDRIAGPLYSDRTINHDLVAVKCLANWGADMEYIPAVNLRRVKRIPLGMPPDKSLSVERVRELLELAQRDDKAEGAPEAPRDGAGAHEVRRRPSAVVLPDGEENPAGADVLVPDPDLAPWLALNYLCLMRPSEVPRLVAREGRFIQPGVFALSRSKTFEKTGVPRHIVLSDKALMWLEQAKPIWSRGDSYYAACARAVGTGPGALRHSAATHLHRLGAARAEVDLLLGHLPPHVSVIYNSIDWQSLRALAARLTL